MFEVTGMNTTTDRFEHTWEWEDESDEGENIFEPDGEPDVD